MLRAKWGKIPNRAAKFLMDERSSALDPEVDFPVLPPWDGRAGCFCPPRIGKPAVASPCFEEREP
jgi:hypothetical protein